jgi:dTDP-4-dehydrorhamnose reductase
VMAGHACRSGALLVHYSTDYVFDGLKSGAYVETDITNPRSVYGRSKRAGEEAILQSGCNGLIFRTSWVFSAHGANFAKTMLRLARERETLRVVDDQIGAPTGADLLAEVTVHAIRAVVRKPELSGLYHLVAGGETSWHGYARFVLDYARQAGVPLKAGPEAVQAVPSSEFPTVARRPLNSRLDCNKLRKSLDFNLPHWQKGVTRMLEEVLESGKLETGQQQRA